MKQLHPINAAKVVLSKHLFEEMMRFLGDIVDLEGEGDFLAVDGGDEHGDGVGPIGQDAEQHFKQHYA